MRVLTAGKILASRSQADITHWTWLGRMNCVTSSVSLVPYGMLVLLIRRPRSHGLTHGWIRLGFGPVVSLSLALPLAPLTVYTLVTAHSLMGWVSVLSLLTHRRTLVTTHSPTEGVGSLFLLTRRHSLRPLLLRMVAPGSVLPIPMVARGLPLRGLASIIATLRSVAAPTGSPLTLASLTAMLARPILGVPISLSMIASPCCSSRVCRAHLAGIRKFSTDLWTKWLPITNTAR